eukprot:5770069-Karenia_brevis.AAC.1
MNVSDDSGDNFDLDVSSGSGDFGNQDCIAFRFIRGKCRARNGSLSRAVGAGPFRKNLLCCGAEGNLLKSIASTSSQLISAFLLPSTVRGFAPGEVGKMHALRRGSVLSAQAT